jgi:hypothetical protein
LSPDGIKRLKLEKSLMRESLKVNIWLTQMMYGIFYSHQMEPKFWLDMGATMHNYGILKMKRS